MVEKKIPKTTFFYHYENVNPKGRYTGDCVIRAISKALNKPWATVLSDLTDMAIKEARMPDDSDLYIKYLSKNGYKKMKMETYSGRKRYTGKEFCAVLENMGYRQPVIAHIGTNHVTTFVWEKENNCYKVHDIRNCTEDKVGVWYARK